jgi:hypothetical protein
MSMFTSRLTRALVVGALLAATNLASMTAAHANDATATNHALRPPTQDQVGESWPQRPSSSGQTAVTGNTRRPPTEGQVGEPWHPRVSTPTPPAAPDGKAHWPVASLTLLASALALSAGLAAKRANRRIRIGHAA